jgi:hypothetical protein
MAGVCSTPGCPELVPRGQCPDCRRKTSRKQHRTVPTKVTRTHAERQRRAAAVRRHVKLHGWLCPGDEAHQSHPCRDLTAHHVDAVADGGDPNGELTVLCRSRNSAIGSRTGR